MLISRSIACLVCAFATSALCFTGKAHAAGFDCAKAQSRVEHLVCDDFSLSMLDGQLAAAYAGALDRSVHPEQIAAKQRVWLGERNACPDAKCLSAAYTRQIAYLSRISDKPAACSGSTTPEIDACAAEYARRADKELDRYVAAARKQIAEDLAQDAGSGSTKDTPAAFDASQAAWTAYRKAECAAVYDTWSDGTIRGSMYQDCMERVTKARTTEVWSDWLTFMDDTPPRLPKPEKESPR